MKQFIPYQTALKLNELGFKQWGTLGVLIESNATKDIIYLSHVEYSNINTYNWTKLSDAVTWQQAFDWFREMGYVIQLDIPDYVSIEGYDDLVYYFKISDYDGWRGGLRNTYKSDSYVSLEEERLLCLEKLIEIHGNK